MFPEVFIDAGSRNEIPFKSGVSHLLSRVAIQVYNTLINSTVEMLTLCSTENPKILRKGSDF